MKKVLLVVAVAVVFGLGLAATKLVNKAGDPPIGSKAVKSVETASGYTTLGDPPIGS